MAYMYLKKKESYHKPPKSARQSPP